MERKARDKKEARAPAMHRFSLRRPALRLLMACLALHALPRAEGAQGSPSGPGDRCIDDSRIRRLGGDLAATAKIESTTQRRRALKRVVRNAHALLERHAAAPNRFALLGLAFRTQKELLILRNDPGNREALLETSRELMEAPYEYAAERLEAEVLLMQLEFDRDGATEHERAVGIAELADNYRGTPAEVDTLIVASELAFNLGQAELLRAFRGTLARRFREDARAIEFLKDRFASKSTSLLFRGHFRRDDGETIVLPIDRAGHVYVSVFWSSHLNDLKSRLMEIKDVQKRNPGKFEVLSFNLDELPDAGKSVIRGLGLDWTVMHLPGGRDNQIFRASGSNRQFLVRMTNANGYIITTPIGSTYRTYGRLTDLDEYVTITLDKAPYLSMVQAARIGDFLVINPFEPVEGNFPSGWREGELPAESLREIQACFTPPPMRYRLSKKQAIENYARAARRCADLIADHAASEHLWWVHNRRTVALLGLWNLLGEPAHLREAVETASASLAVDAPPEARIIPRFCLAKAALRAGGADADAVLADFMEAVGGEHAPPLAIGAAAVLSLDATSPVLFEKYREMLLDDHLDEPSLWSLTAYFFNKFAVGRLFRGNYYSSDVRIYHGFRSWQQSTEVRPRKFQMKLENLAGEEIMFPHADPDKSNAIVFMDLPADAASAKVQVDLVKHLEAAAESHLRNNVNLILAFVSEDRNAARRLARRNGWSRGRIAFVPAGMKNPHVLRLGVFMADKRPNTFTVASDGTITWSMTGMYQMSAGANGVADTVKRKIQAQDITTGNGALEKGEFEKALRIFKGSFPSGRFYPGAAGNAQRRGRARAHKGLGSHEAALKEYDEIVAEHTASATRRPCPCFSLARKLLARADILENLGRDDDAAADRRRAESLRCPRGGTIRFAPTRFEQELFNRLEGFISRKDWRAALEYIDEVIVRGKDGRQPEREEFARLLRERAEALRHTSEKAKAERDLEWADALTKGIEARSDEEQGGHDPQRKRYVDIVTM